MSVSRDGLQLSQADQMLFDRLAEAGFDPDAVEAGNATEQQRLVAITRLLNLLEDYPVDDAEDVLIHATIARIHRTDASRHVLAAIGPDDTEASEGSQRRLIRLPDFLSIAAVLLLGVSVAWPVLGMLRQRSIDAGCVNNLRTLGSALESYARSNNGNIPMAVAGFGPTASQVARWVDLAPLTEQGYCPEGHANCPGHTERMGYSRQVVTADSKVSWFTTQSADTSVLGDRNPIIDARALGDRIDPFANSRNHRGRGQNLLQGDNSTIWLEVPYQTENDNIWLIDGQSDYQPGAVPDSEHDVYLTH
ncbi:MAG: hypothetical protein ACR2GY_06970 [Phycisphaerales bacterium]